MKLFQDLVYTGYYKATTGHHLLLKSHSGFQSIGHYLPPSLCMEASVFRKSRKSQTILKSTIKKITQEIYLRWKEALPVAFLLTHITGFPDSSVGEECACHVGRLDSIPGLGRSPGDGNGYHPSIFGLENSKERVHQVAKSWTRLSDFHFHSHNS